MRFVMFYHSVVSDWNHGNAHFLRGVADDLIDRGHTVDIYEPEDGWSLQNLKRDHGEEPIRAFFQAYPRLKANFYDLQALDLDAVLDEADVVLVHEWNDPQLVSRIGRHHADHSHYRLLFHDTHHRAVTAPEEMDQYDLTHFDGVLAFGTLIRELYRKERHVARAWVWHEAADPRVFYPREAAGRDGDLVWIGNWGDDERSGELHDYLCEPVRRLGLTARVYGVRYPQSGLKALEQAGIEYGGWLPNYRVPEVFSRFQVTLHIPRRPYRESIPGIPTIRVFEALACGIPLVCLRWEDLDGLFTPGEDYLVAETTEEMVEAIQSILDEPDLADRLADRGRQTILARHTCTHRVDELLAILDELDGNARPEHRDQARRTASANGAT